MSFFIKSKNKALFVHTEIDSGGMSVSLMDIIYADKFGSIKDAESFMQRCLERYPTEELVIVEITQLIWERDAKDGDGS